jgi:hypothetical protein
MTKNLRKNMQIKNCLKKNSNLLMSKSTGEDFSPQKREHPAHQKMKFMSFFYVCGLFLTTWIPIANPATDPGISSTCSHEVDK